PGLYLHGSAEPVYGRQPLSADHELAQHYKRRLLVRQPVVQLRREPEFTAAALAWSGPKPGAQAASDPEPGRTNRRGAVPARSIRDVAARTATVLGAEVCARSRRCSPGVAPARGERPGSDAAKSASRAPDADRRRIGGRGGGAP